MKRTKSEAEETRQRLLQAGLRVFLEKGFDRASLEEIAQREGLTRGAVYWHFKDKQALFAALMEQKLRPVQEQIEGLLKDTELSPLQKITTFVRRLLHLLTEDREFAALQQLLLTTRTSQPDYSRTYSLWQEHYLQELEQLFWQAQTDRAVLAHVSPRYLATYTLGLISGLSQHYQEQEFSAAEASRQAERMLFLFMRSLQ